MNNHIELYHYPSFDYKKQKNILKNRMGITRANNILVKKQHNYIYAPMPYTIVIFIYGHLFSICQLF